MNLFQAAGFPFSNVGLSKTWVGFGSPSFKMDALFEMHRKNADAVVSANYVVLDGLNRLAQRQGELFAATVNDYTKVTRDVFAGASLEEKASSQVGAVRHVYASSVASLRELSDIAVNTNVTVADILTNRLARCCIASIGIKNPISTVFDCHSECSSTSAMKDVPMNSFQAAGFPFANTDLTKAWAHFKMPSLNIGALLEAHRKNAAALINANQVVFDGLKTLAQRQGDLFKTTVEDCSRVTSDLLVGVSFEERASKQADATRHIYVSSRCPFPRAVRHRGQSQRHCS